MQNWSYRYPFWLTPQHRLHAWQQHISRQVGEPVFLRLTVVYDGYFELEIRTMDGDSGSGKDWELSIAVQMAVGDLLAGRMVRRERGLS